MLSVGVLLLVATVPLVQLPHAVPALAEAMAEGVEKRRSRSTWPSAARHRGATVRTSRACSATASSRCTSACRRWASRSGSRRPRRRRRWCRCCWCSNRRRGRVQVRASRGTHDVRRAGIAVRRGSWLLAGACVRVRAGGVRRRRDRVRPPRPRRARPRSRRVLGGRVAGAWRSARRPSTRRGVPGPHPRPGTPWRRSRARPRHGDRPPARHDRLDRARGAVRGSRTAAAWVARRAAARRAGTSDEVSVTAGTLTA